MPNKQPNLRKRFAKRRSKGEMVDKQQDLFRADTPAEVTSVRAKSQRHRKVTADRWNQ